MFKVPEQYRVTKGPFASDKSAGNNGLFMVPLGKRVTATIIASDGLDWEHVSVTIHQGREPRWGEMCKIKQLFWGPDDVVVQYHPAESEYVDIHPHCLHLWRSTKVVMPKPPLICV